MQTDKEIADLWELPEPRTPAVSLSTNDVRFADIGALTFRNGLPLAVRMHGYAYFPDRIYKPGETRAMNESTKGWTQVPVPADQFSFIVGQVLAQAGLRLTALPRETHDRNPAPSTTR